MTTKKPASTRRNQIAERAYESRRDEWITANRDLIRVYNAEVETLGLFDDALQA
jgi:hypothetical protein